MPNWREVMVQDWETLASKNPFYWVFTSDEFSDPDTCDIDKFFASGRIDVDNILQALHVKPNAAWSVLDIGCGLGRLTRRLAELFGPTVGVDVSGKMVERAASLTPGPGVQFRQTSGVDLKDFPDASFDLVFSFIVLQHLPRSRLVLNYIAEMARVLRSGGLALFQLATSFFPAWKLAYWRRLQPKRANRDFERPSVRGSWQSAGTVQRHAFQLGLTPEAVLYEGTPWTYFRLAKIDTNRMLAEQRSAGQSRVELQRWLG
jgi:SAM-dependent methyltransferase